MIAPNLDTISLGPLTIQVWGTMVGLGFLVGYFYTLRRAQKFGIAKNHIQNLALIILLLSIVGARLGHIILFPAEFLKNPAEIFRIDHGGMVFVGGFVGGILGILGYLGILGRMQKLGKLGVWEMFWKLADVMAPAVALGYGIGRIGCFLTDLHPGIPTSLPWGVEYAGVLRHPTALYSSLAGFLIWIGLVRYEKVSPTFAKATAGKKVAGAGRIAILFLILFTLYRFGVDFLRAYDLGFDERFFGLTVTQWLLPIFTLALSLGRKFYQK